MVINRAAGSFGDSLWSAFTTVTSVGYGDAYPVTPGGKVVAAFFLENGQAQSQTADEKLTEILHRLSAIEARLEVSAGDTAH